MHQETYKVMDGNVTLATGMNLDTACILVKALFETYYEESDISYEIVREDEKNIIAPPSLLTREAYAEDEDYEL